MYLRTLSLLVGLPYLGALLFNATLYFNLDLEFLSFLYLAAMYGFIVLMPLAGGLLYLSLTKGDRICCFYKYNAFPFCIGLLTSGK